MEHNGVPQVKLSVSWSSSARDDKYPTAATCSNALYLPRYSVRAPARRVHAAFSLQPSSHSTGVACVACLSPGA